MNGFALAAFARGGGIDEVKIGDGFFQRVIELGRFKHEACSSGGGLGFLVHPVFARAHHAQFMQAEIRHSARGHADVFAELRLDQNDNRLVAHCAATFCKRRACSKA